MVDPNIPARTNTFAISSETGTSGGLVTSILNGGVPISQPPSGQILNRAAFYSSNGNVGGNLIVLSMNQGPQLFDFNRLVDLLKFDVFILLTFFVQLLLVSIQKSIQLRIVMNEPGSRERSK